VPDGVLVHRRGSASSWRSGHGIVQNVRVQKTVIANVPVALKLSRTTLAVFDLDFFVNVDALTATLALTAEAQETGVAQSHVRYFPDQDGIAGIGSADGGHI
jgi:hypothetical protein